MTSGKSLLESVLAEIGDQDDSQRVRAVSFVHLLSLSGAQMPPAITKSFSAFDWPCLVEIAHRQGLLPLLRDKILEAIPVTPDTAQLRASLLEDRLHSAQRNLALAAETIRLVSAFEKEGIRVVPFKGSVLSSIAFGNLALRRPGDIDLLVQPADVEKASALLASLSYVSLHERGPAWQAGHLGYDCEWEFVSRAKYMGVDLHWNFTAHNFGLSFPIRHVWARTLRMPFCGYSVETFSPEDLILILSVHAVKHYCRQFEWILTIAQLLKKFPDFAWDELLLVARQYGALRHLGICLLLADQFYGAPVPASVRERLFRDKPAEKLAARALRWAITGECRHITDVQQRFFISSTRIGLLSKLRYWWAVILTPNEKDYRIELPRWLWAGYPILRVGRLLAELVGWGGTRGTPEPPITKTATWNFVE